MAIELKLKPAYANVESGFSNRWAKMGERSPEELRAFYARAQQHKIQSDLDMFDMGEGEPAKVEPVALPAHAAPIVKKQKKPRGGGRSKAKAAPLLEVAAVQAALSSEQTPQTEEQAALNEIHGEAAPGTGSPTAATVNTAITPAANA